MMSTHPDVNESIAVRYARNAEERMRIERDEALEEVEALKEKLRRVAPQEPPGRMPY